MAIAADVQAALDALRKEKDADIAALKLEIEDTTPFVGFVLNNWQVRPALIVTDPEGETGLIVFTAGVADGAEYAGGVIFVRGARKNNTKHIPGTWHDQEG